MEQKDSKRFITPGGAGLAAICFFLPWIRACGQDLSGSQIASNNNSLLWLVLIAALAITGGFFMYDRQYDLKKLKPLVIGGASLSFLILLIKYNQAREQGGMMFEIQYGAIGTLLGFTVSLLGLQFLKGTVSPSADKFCAECGEKITSNSTFCNQCGAKIKP